MKKVLLVVAFAMSLFLIGISNATSVSGNKNVVQFEQLPSNVHLIHVLNQTGYSAQVNTGSLKSDEGLPDGTYQFQVLGLHSERQKSYKQQLNNGRDASSPQKAALRVLDEGRFELVNGVVVTHNSLEQEQ